MGTWPALWPAVRLAPRRAAIAAVTWYQRVVSPLSAPSCRFAPTCSQYTAEAIGRYGVLYGGLLAAWRIARCHPLGGRGWDPPRPFGAPAPPPPDWMRDDAPETTPAGTEPDAAG